MLRFRKKIGNRLRSLYRRTLGFPLRSITELGNELNFAQVLRYGDQAMGTRAVAENLFFAVQYAAESTVEGDVAEFGCMTGRTAQVIAASMQLTSADKSLHLFDSFEGLPSSTSGPDAESVHVQTGVWARGMCKGITPEELRRRCRRFLNDDRIHIYEGWFSETLPQLPARTGFAVIHVDCDLYQSTVDVLDFLFSSGRVSDGAVILFDDWNCNRASNQHGERRAWQEMVAKYRIESSDFGAYGWAGHKFIVHSYARG